MSRLLAINTYYYMGTPKTILHTNVVELEKLSSNRRFRCESCGLEWIENINSPQIVSDNDIKDLKYPVQKCSKK